MEHNQGTVVRPLRLGTGRRPDLISVKRTISSLTVVNQRMIVFGGVTVCGGTVTWRNLIALLENHGMEHDT